MLWSEKQIFGWWARKEKYRLALEKSLSGLNPAAILPEEQAAIVAVTEALHVEKFKILRSSEIEKELSFLLQPPIASNEQIYFPGARRKRALSEQESLPGESSGQKDWLLAMPGHFRKCIKNIDRKLQGRILQAISEICQDPMTPRGDTVEPLTQDMRGCWRYRIKQFRLLYQPVPDRREIILVNFEARGSVYD